MLTLEGVSLGPQHASMDMVSPGSATSARLPQDPGVTADEHQVLYGSRYEGGGMGCSRTEHWLCQGPAWEWGWVPAWGVAQGIWLCMRGMGMQKNCRGVLSLLHTLITELSMWGTVLKTVPVCFCPRSLSQRYHSPSILACPASGMLEGDAGSSEELKDHQ